ncbi:hypothetical protein [Moritella sp.]|uniref:hypothetical protein n=1 Tax=Moritella sp. TaxID=78556 RepID=UPI0025CBD391|nr:hypothetical protein [Moritella sp.]
MGHCYNTININAPIDKVWETISNFHDLSWAAGVITSLRIVGAQHNFSYSIDNGPGPIAKDAVDNYIGSVKLSQTHTLSDIKCNL